MSVVFGQEQKRRTGKSHLEERLAQYIQLQRLPAPVREFQFAAPARRWKFDFAWPDRGVALEIEGGTWVQGRHNTGTGMRSDCEKYNAAASMGWVVYRVTVDMVRDGTAYEVVTQALKPRVTYQSPVLAMEA